jgi:hypothetical protein
MQVNGIRSLLVLGLLSLFVPLGCGDDEELDLSTGGTGGSQPGGGSGGSGGSSGNGGSGASGGSAGNPAGGGTAGASGAAGTSGDSGRCPVQGTTYQFDWCPTLMTQEEANSLQAGIVPQFIGDIHFDCRINKMVDDDPGGIPQFGNDVSGFTLELWGCQGDGVSHFGLANGSLEEASVPTLTAADAALLIEKYVSRTVLVLELGPSLEKLLFDTLTCLAEGAITNPSTTDYTFSSCPPDAGADASEDASTTSDGGTD